MGNAQDTTASSQDAYRHQKMYEVKKAKNKVVLGWVFLAVTAFLLLSIFIFPLYDYKNIDAVTGKPITVEYNAPKMISEYFSGGFGDYAVLNTLVMISLVLVIALIVYILVASFITVVLKDKTSKLIRKLTSFTSIEVASTLLLIFLIINMVSAKIDVSGNATNKIGYWIQLIISALLVCFSITLSTPNTDKK